MFSVEWYEDMIAFGELERTGEEAVVVYLKVQSKHSASRTTVWWVFHIDTLQDTQPKTLHTKISSAEQHLSGQFFKLNFKLNILLILIWTTLRYVDVYLYVDYSAVI
jgi:hypothetical protein